MILWLAFDLQNRDHIHIKSQLYLSSGILIGSFSFTLHVRKLRKMEDIDFFILILLSNFRTALEDWYIARRQIQILISEWQNVKLKFILIILKSPQSLSHYMQSVLTFKLLKLLNPMTFLLGTIHFGSFQDGYIYPLSLSAKMNVWRHSVCKTKNKLKK